MEGVERNLRRRSLIQEDRFRRSGAVPEDREDLLIFVQQPNRLLVGSGAGGVLIPDGGGAAIKIHRHSESRPARQASILQDDGDGEVGTNPRP